MQKITTQNEGRVVKKIEISFEIVIKTAEDILMKFRVLIECFLTLNYCYRTLRYFGCKRDLEGGGTTGNYQIAPKLLTLRQISLEAKL